MKTELEDQEWLSVSQAAKVMNVSRAAVYLAIGEGRLPAQKVGNLHLVRRRDAEGYQKRHRTNGRGGPNFWRNVKMGDGCWEWQGCQAGKGYGKCTMNGKEQYCHKISYEMHFGPVPEGLWVLHRCDNPICVRPDHLFVGTASDNAQDRQRKGRGRKKKAAEVD